MQNSGVTSVIFKLHLSVSVSRKVPGKQSQSFAWWPDALAMPAEQVAKFGKGCRESMLQGSYCARALFGSGPGLLGLSEDKAGWQRLVKKAFEMGLGRGLLRMPFGMVVRGCRSFAFFRHSLAVL